MPKKPIDIPVHVATGSVPHYYDEYNKTVVSAAKSLLEEGYAAWIESTKEVGFNRRSYYGGTLSTPATI